MADDITEDSEPKPLHRRMHDTAVALPILTTYLFLAGWLYNQSYYGYFGLDHRNLGLPFQIYLISPWFVYLTVLLSLPMYLGTYDITVALATRRFAKSREIKEKTPSGVRRFTPSLGTILHWLFGLLIVLLCFVEMANLALLFDPPILEVFWGAIALFVFAVIFPYFEPDKMKAMEKKARRYNALVYLYFAMLILHQVALGGHTRATEASLKSDKKLPQVVIVWNDKVPEDGLDPISKEALDLRLMWASSSELYVFSPRETKDSKVPKIYCIPRDKVRYYVQQ